MGLLFLAIDNIWLHWHGRFLPIQPHCRPIQFLLDRSNALVVVDFSSIWFFILMGTTFIQIPSQLIMA
jgi:hypothetical protein